MKKTIKESSGKGGTGKMDQDVVREVWKLSEEYNHGGQRKRQLQERGNSPQRQMPIQRLSQVSIKINPLDSGIRLTTSLDFQCYSELFLNPLIYMYFCGKSRNSAVEAFSSWLSKQKSTLVLGFLFCFVFSIFANLLFWSRTIWLQIIVSYSN